MERFVSSIIGDKCYRTFFINGDLMDMDCLKYSISKGLGYGIVIGSGIMKLTQILKIVMNRDVTGLNAMSFYMECAAFLPSIVYNFLKGYPISTYGENVVILFQNYLLVFLFWIFAKGENRKSILHMLLVILAFILYTFVLFYCPQKVLSLTPVSCSIFLFFPWRVLFLLYWLVFLKS